MTAADRANERTLDRLLAIALAMLLPLLVGALLMRGVQVPGVPTTQALQLVWIDPPRSIPLDEPAMPQPARSDTPPPPAPMPPRLREPATPPAMQVVEIPALQAPAEPSVPTPSSHSLLQQARQAAMADARPDFTQDPLANRPTGLEGGSGGRFAMRRTMSAQDVVVGVGQLLFGGSPDPCPEIRQDIARHTGVGNARERERLQEALRRERAGNCR